MLKKKVFKNSRSISCIGIGALHFGNFTDENESKKIIEYSINEGVNYFDTAPMYGNSNSEKILGSVLKNYRKNVIIGTKIGLKTIGSGKSSRAELIKLNKKNIEVSIDKSLKSLQTDYIDYFQLHYFDQETPIIETLEALEIAKKKGKILEAGICNYDKNHLEQLFNLGPISNIITGLHSHYNILERRLEKELLEIIEKKKISLLSYQVFARGFLTGKYSKDEEISRNTRAFNSRRFERYFKNEMFESLNKIKKISSKYNSDIKEVAISWLIDKNYVTCGVMGFRNLEQTKEIIDIIKNKINQEMIAEVDRLILGDKFLLNYIYNVPNPFLET